MKMSYLNNESELKNLNAGSPQGAYLGGIIFIIKFNGAFLRPPVPRPMAAPLGYSEAEKAKYIDDGTVAVSIPLKKSLVNDPILREKPLNFHERTGHILPKENNLLQYYINDFEEFVVENDMKINREKTNVMLINPSRKFDFPPQMAFSNNEEVKVVSEVKLVGVLISDNLKWENNTRNIVNKAMRKIWVLRRLKQMKMSNEFIIDVYIKELRSKLEQAVPVWNAGLTKAQDKSIERVQKTALSIIFGIYINRDNYARACSIAGIETLAERRKALSLNYGLKNFKSKHSSKHKNGYKERKEASQRVYL